MTSQTDLMIMAYEKRKETIKKTAKEYTVSREKLRCDMINSLRLSGKLESDWHIIEEFDKETQYTCKIFITSI